MEILGKHNDSTKEQKQARLTKASADSKIKGLES